LSLAVAFKGPEGIVLAADSRVTLSGELPTGELIPAYFDHATKLLSVRGQTFVGVITYGQGAIDQTEPRTAHSYIPEFDAHLAEQGIHERLTVKDFANELGSFFMGRWQGADMAPAAPPMSFLIAGFDENEAYGKVLEVSVPSALEPVERNHGTFGLTWGGQSEFVSRLVNGTDPRTTEVIRGQLGLDDAQARGLRDKLREELALPIPYQFLSLRDCVDLSEFLVHMTATIQTWTVGDRGVGGAVDVATITRTDGFRAIQ
jgi:hypothetical protein